MDQKTVKKIHVEVHHVQDAIDSLQSYADLLLDSIDKGVPAGDASKRAFLNGASGSLVRAKHAQATP